MTITFEELRNVKDRLPVGGVHKIATILGVSDDTIRNYFGGDHFQTGESMSVHIESNPIGDFVRLDDDTIYNMAIEMIEGKI